MFSLNGFNLFPKKRTRPLLIREKTIHIGFVSTSTKSYDLAAKILIFCEQRNCGKGGLAQDSLNGVVLQAGLTANLNSPTGRWSPFALAVVGKEHS